MFWHVPTNAWFDGGPAAGGGVGNVGADIVIPLVASGDDVGERPVNDNFVIERIVGQYQVTGDESVPVDKYVHSRVYVAESDAASLSLRNLTTADDAETSFLWHQVGPWDTVNDGVRWGDWLGVAAGTPPATPWAGRLGHVDIRVGRRIEGGETLIWHTQFDPTPAIVDTMFLKLWLRMLCREM